MDKKADALLFVITSLLREPVTLPAQTKRPLITFHSMDNDEINALKVYTRQNTQTRA